MSKSKRLMELMMTVNRKRKFTVKELAAEFGVSPRTMLRDLQELSTLGIPLYSEVGPHGGYQVLSERVLPPIAFTEKEAAAIFFANHALRHYAFLPFETETASVLSKFYNFMPGDVRDHIDQMKNRVDFMTPMRQSPFPHLALLLDGAVRQQVLRIEYEGRKAHVTSRHIQPVGIYAASGFWYCPAFCFERGDFRLFRCDRIRSAALDSSGPQSRDLREIHLGNWESFITKKPAIIDCYVELGREGVHACESALARRFRLTIHEDGTGKLEGQIPRSEIPFLARFFIGLGDEATVHRPPELVSAMREMLLELMRKYE